MEYFRLPFGHLAWIEHQFLSGLRDSMKAGSLWGMMRGVGGVRKSIHQSWLAKGLGLGLLCWGFKGVQAEIPWEEASTLQIGSVAFPPGQCTSPQLHPCHWLFDKDRHQDTSSPSSMGPSKSCWDGTTSALQPEEITSKGTRVLSIKVPIRKKSGNLLNDPRAYGHFTFIICMNRTLNYIWRWGPSSEHL